MRGQVLIGRAALFWALAGPLAWPLLALGDDGPDDRYIKVEIRGTLESGIVAIGGETTGVMISVRNVAWELDLGDDETLHDAARRLNGKTVLVTGAYHRIAGVEIPHRDIVTVTTLEAAAEERHGGGEAIPATR